MGMENWLKEFFKAWLATMLALFSAARAAFEFYSYVDGEVAKLKELSPVFYWLLAFITFAGIAIFQGKWELHKLLGTFPLVEPLKVVKTHHPQIWQEITHGEQSSYQGTAVMKVGMSITRTEDNEFTHILFANNLSRLKGVRSAQRVIAKIMFFELDKTPVLSEDLDGRWDVPEPTDDKFKGEPGDLLEVEIPNNTRPRRLTVLVKPKNAPICYAYAHNWYNATQTQIGQYALPKSTYFLKIVLIGTDYYPDPYWFRLKIGEKGESSELQPVKQPF